jgi:flagellar biosynthesis component FlhA
LARNDSFLVFQTGLESNSKLSFFSNFSNQLFTPLPRLLPLLHYSRTHREKEMEERKRKEMETQQEEKQQQEKKPMELVEDEKVEKISCPFIYAIMEEPLPDGNNLHLVASLAA